VWVNEFTIAVQHTAVHVEFKIAHTEKGRLGSILNI
jgi:hypothetical protein